MVQLQEKFKQNQLKPRLKNSVCISTLLESTFALFLTNLGGFPRYNGFGGLGRPRVWHCSPFVACIYSVAVSRCNPSRSCSQNAHRKKKLLASVKSSSVRGLEGDRQGLKSNQRQLEDDRRQFENKYSSSQVQSFMQKAVEVVKDCPGEEAEGRWARGGEEQASALPITNIPSPHKTTAHHRDAGRPYLKAEVLSRPLIGSSRKITLGSRSRSIPTLNRRRCPPEIPFLSSSPTLTLRAS